MSYTLKLLENHLPHQPQIFRVLSLPSSFDLRKHPFFQTGDLDDLEPDTDWSSFDEDFTNELVKSFDEGKIQVFNSFNSQECQYQF